VTGGTRRPRFENKTTGTADVEALILALTGDRNGGGVDSVGTVRLSNDRRRRRVRDSVSTGSGGLHLLNARQTLD